MEQLENNNFFESINSFNNIFLVVLGLLALLLICLWGSIYFCSQRL